MGSSGLRFALIVEAAHQIHECRGAMQFFIWYDDTPKKPVVEKIDAAIAAYVERFKTRPNLVLVNALDYLELADVVVRSGRTVQPNSFRVGHEEGADLPAA